MEVLRRLIASEESNLRALAILLDEDPKTFYIGTDLGGVDLRGQDLRGMDFFRTNIERAIFDGSCKFDEELEEYLGLAKVKKYLEISEDLLRFCDRFYSDKKFRTRGWFIKAIVPQAADAIKDNPDGWIRVLESSRMLLNFFRPKDRKRIELKFAIRDYETGELVGRRFGGRGPALTALIIVGLLVLIDFDPKTDTVVPKKDKWIKEFHLFEKNRILYL